MSEESQVLMSIGVPEPVGESPNFGLISEIQPWEKKGVILNEHFEIKLDYKSDEAPGPDPKDIHIPPGVTWWQYFFGGSK